MASSVFPFTANRSPSGMVSSYGIFRPPSGCAELSDLPGEGKRDPLMRRMQLKDHGPEISFAVRVCVPSHRTDPD